jgi:carbon-monoxide dehydrogenase medium subunit
MQDFDYVRVHEVHEAISMLSREENGAVILSGGTDLLVQLREKQRQARLLVDIKSIPEVNELKFDPSTGLSLGSAVSCLRIRDDSLISQIYPGLVDAVSLIGSIQIQGRASVGGNLCNASPAADTIPALIVHRTVCIIAGPEGYREVPVEDFCVAPGENILQPGELLVSLRIPPPPPRFGAHYLRFTPRNEMDIAVTGAGAAIAFEEDLQTVRWARLALSAVAPTPLFVEAAGEYLAGQEISSDAIQETARLAQDATHPIQDMRGTVNQRSHLVGILARRALEKAIDRATERVSPPEA